MSSEQILIVAVIVVLVAPQYLISLIKNPWIFYVQLFAAVGLLILIWTINPYQKGILKILMTAVVLGSMYKNYLNFRKATPK